jgi:hypothetical protein
VAFWDSVVERMHFPVKASGDNFKFLLEVVAFLPRLVALALKSLR